MDDKTQEIIGIVVRGIGEIFQKVMAAYATPTTQIAQVQSPPVQSTPDQQVPIQNTVYTSTRPSPQPQSTTTPSQTSSATPNEGKTPTWRKLLELYEECAKENLVRNFKPCERRRKANILGVKKCLQRLNIGLDEPYTALTRARIRELEDIGLKEGFSRETINAWRAYFKSVTSRWACLMYDDRGWHVRSIETLPFNTASKSYVALPKENVEKIDEWIESLRQDETRKEDYKLVWLMRNFAVRNGDVFRYKCGNLTNVIYKGKKCVRSAYIPHKTSKTSRRKATWEISKRRYDREILPIKPKNATDDTPFIEVANDTQIEEMQRRLNAEIRLLLPPGRNKGLYELRKLCANEIFVKYGRKACVRATGDSFETLEHNYVDTSVDDDD